MFGSDESTTNAMGRGGEHLIELAGKVEHWSAWSAWREIPGERGVFHRA